MRLASLVVFLTAAVVSAPRAQTVSVYDRGGTLHRLGAHADTDGDGIENALEINGFEFDLLSGEIIPWDGDESARYFITDPLRVSTDGDPYSDLQEATGANMPSSVQPPYNHPLVAARPVIGVYMSSYDVIPNGTITDEQGGSESESFTNETSNEESFSVGIEGTVEFSPTSLGSVTMSSEYSQTWVNTTSSTSTESFDWSTARAVNEAEAAYLRLNVYYVNNGSAPASNVRPTFTLQLGNKTIATFLASANSEALSLVPGGRFPQNGSIAIDRYVAGEVEVQIALTLNELRAIQRGAPLRLSVPQVEATIQRWNPATQSYDNDVTWSAFEDDIDPVSLTIEAVVDGTPKQYQVYAPVPGTFGETRTVGDALGFVFDVNERAGGTTIDGRSYPLDWYLSTDSDLLYDNWLAAGSPANLLEVETEAGARLAMLSSSGAEPRVDFASYSRDLSTVYASALPINGFPIQSAKATLYGRDRTFEIPLDDPSFGAFLANSAPVNEPYYGGIVTVLNARGEARVEPIASPAGPTRFRICADIQAGNPSARDSEFPLFMTGRFDRPTLVECEFSNGAPPVERPWLVATEAPDDLRTLRVVDEATIVGTSGGDIQRSTDGGQTWTQPSVNDAWVGDIAFADSSTGFAVGTDGGAGQSGRILRTRNGGATWTSVQQGFINEPISAVAMLDAQTVVVAGGGSSDDILLSTDGGQSWRPIYTAGGGSIGALRYAGILGASRIVAQQSSNKLLLSADDGATWSEVFPYQSAGVPPGVLLGLDFPTPQVGYAIAAWSTQPGTLNNTALLKSEDGGATWREVPIPTSGTLNETVFLDALAGFVTGSDDQVYHTVDGGLTWYAQRAGNRGVGTDINVRGGLGVLRVYNPTTATSSVYVTRSVDYSEGPGGEPFTIKPKSLLAYDGVPARIGGASTPEQAQDILDDYGVVLLGEGGELAENYPTVQDWEDTQTLVRGLTASGTKVYGTIDLGVTTANLPIGGNGPTEGPNTAVIYRV
ncbi:MAG: binary toxin-like calcium binding domain-containing protein, partial [Bacteroidota bacterium]